MFGLLRQLDSVLAVKGLQVCFLPANTGRVHCFLGWLRVRSAACALQPAFSTAPASSTLQRHALPTFRPLTHPQVLWLTVRARAVLQGLAAAASCTSESTAGEQYGAICYDVGGCCPSAATTADAVDQSSLKGEKSRA
jgi:hypothetical protein